MSTSTLLKVLRQWSFGGSGEDSEPARSPAGGGAIGLWRFRDAEVPRGLIVFLLFSRDLSAKQLSFISFLNVSVFVRIHVLYL